MSAQDAAEFVGNLDCSGAETPSGSGVFNVSIGGTVRANRSLSGARITGYVEPGGRLVGSHLLGNIAAGRSRSFNITGTVSGATPTRCRVELQATAAPSDPSPPPPTPDPEPPPTGACRPTTTALQFDGGYKVSMCYRTPDGREGQAKSGVWASSQAGLLWFFDRENAEVLVKVLNGCTHNAHRWVYVAPVTDLEFNLWVTGPDGRRWTHSNRQGTTASSKADTRAFQCSNENGGTPPSSAPDLVVSSPSVSNSSPRTGGSFTLRATVRNQGDDRSGATTLRYYRSSNSAISTSDTQVGTDAVSALSASASSAESIGLTAPSSAGTYYYGACVDSVSGESATNNNCSNAVRIIVEGSSPPPGDSYCRNNSVVRPGGRCDIYNTSFYFEVRSDGTGCLRAGGILSCSGGNQNWRNSLLNGVRVTFVASRNSDDSWTISEVDPHP